MKGRGNGAKNIDCESGVMDAVFKLSRWTSTPPPPRGVMVICSIVYIITSNIWIGRQANNRYQFA